MMRYCYDLIVNLDNSFWEFYEWEEQDNLVSLKKVPLIKVSDFDLRQFLQYDVCFDEEWIKPFLGKTLLRGKKEKLSCLLFSSGRDCVVFEVNEKGCVVARSRLLITDENHCNELVASLKSEFVPYKLLNKLTCSREFRKANYEKHLIEVELDTLEASGNVSKCAFFYYEWFGFVEDNLEKMIWDCREELKKEYTIKMHEIASLILLSYKGCL